MGGQTPVDTCTNIARQALVDANRGDKFAADLGLGDTPSDQLVAFLGRKPL